MKSDLQAPPPIHLGPVQLTPELIEKFGERHHAKRRQNISAYRWDGSLRTPDVDIQSGSAEYVAARYYDQDIDDAVYETHGDEGYDFPLRIASGGLVREVGVGIIWWGYRSIGGLMTTPGDEHRYRATSIFVLLAGYLDDKTNIADMRMIGWLPKHIHWDLTRFPLQPKGDGESLQQKMRHYSRDLDLWDMRKLDAMVEQAKILDAQKTRTLSILTV